jgi:hypothetical protein
MANNRAVPENEQDRLLNLARDEWRDVYHNGSYTTLLMLDFWIKKWRITYEDYLNNPARILDEDDLVQYRSRVQTDSRKIANDDEFPRTKDWLSRLDDAEFDNVIDNGTGRCTSFAIQTVRALNMKYKDKFDFKYYRFGIHQLARCARTGIVIDSTHEPHILKEGDKFTAKPTTDSFFRKLKSLPSNIISWSRIPPTSFQGREEVSTKCFRVDKPIKLRLYHHRATMDAQFYGEMPYIIV